MKKISIVSAVSLLFLIVCSAVAKLTVNFFDSYPTPLIIGLSVLTASGLLALIVRDRTPVNILCSTLSAIAMGFIVRAWYILRGIENSLVLMLLISLGAVVYLWIYFALIRIPVVKESAGVTVAVSVLYAVISLVIYLLLVFRTETTFVSTVGFYAILELSFIFAMSFEVNDHHELIRNLTLSTYSVLIVAIIVIVFAIMAGGGDCDCDCGGCDCNGCDCGDGGGKTTKKSKKTPAPLDVR